MHTEKPFYRAIWYFYRVSKNKYTRLMSHKKVTIASILEI